MKPLTKARRAQIGISLNDVLVMLANWPEPHDEFRGRLKELRRDVKAAAKLVAACVEQGELYAD